MAHKHENDSFLNGLNAEYVAHLFGEYLSDASKVDESWRKFFQGMESNELELLAELSGASWTPDKNKKSSRRFGVTNVILEDESQQPTSGRRTDNPVNQDNVKQAALDSVRALMLIRSYRSRGHLYADLDPLGMKDKGYHPELDPAHFGFTPEDYDRPIFVNGVFGLDNATLREILALLEQTYCSKIGVEFLHLDDPEEKKWIQDRIEQPRNKTNFTTNGKRAILESLVAAEGFEHFLHKKNPGTKRFGIDGGEALIPAIEQVMKRGGQLGVKEIVLGMAHRGRLNVLANVMNKPYTTIFAEFQGQSSTPDDVLGAGDVKYHMGVSADRDFEDNTIHLSLTANPSHLEFVNPVVIGKVRAKQVQRNDKSAEQVVPMLLHGDAAFAGQGIIAETLMISDLPGYRVGGTVHIVINNQIGFTTMPNFSRSGPYCTDVAKMLAAPIFHVNGDDPEAVVHVSRIATEFRQKFKRDVVIDLFCYRRFGHNEGDEPAFTQPLMYKKIATHPTTREIYAKQLVDENVITKEEAQGIYDDFMSKMEDDFQATKSFKPNSADYLEGAWTGLKVADDPDAQARRGSTAVSEQQIQKAGKILTHVPDGFEMNSKLKRIIKNRAKMIETGKSLDWAMGENLAYATLLDDQHNVRLSGQDVGRGTFSHRHAIWYDQKTGEKYIPLRHMEEEQTIFEAHDSPLSEMAVLGFEYGFSLADPNTLTIWEAQFGDFANGAQVMIDQFISSGEGKWLRMSGLVLLLPHGYEGQGPEHSSARPERFLQMAAEDNWQICNCTTPANMFHALRRQMKRDFRKPLVMMTPKSLLRHKLAVSDLDMFTGESSFHRFLWDDDHKELVAPDKIKRVILCTGKIYYDLLQERRERGIKDITILRVEQLYPFPMNDLATEIAPFKNAEIIWCQEEPMNQGYWHFVDRRIEATLGKINHKAGRPIYIGRKSASAPATGHMSRHISEQTTLIDNALRVE